MTEKAAQPTTIVMRKQKWQQTMTDNHDNIREFLENLPDTFDILEEGIDVQTQKEYIDYSHSFDRGELTEAETINLGNILLDTRTEIEAKKKETHCNDNTSYKDRWNW